MHAKSRLVIDVLMIIGMFFSMNFHFFGVGTHKMIGLATFLFFIIHNILNRKWYKTLFSGKYKMIRIVHTFTNIVTIVAMFGIIVSGVILSKEMANGVVDEMTIGRILHLVSSYVECIGIALHIGFHLKKRKSNA